VRRKNATESPSQGTLLLLIDRRDNPLSRFLRQHDFRVIEAFTTDQAVAVAVNNRIDAAVLDQDFFVETDGWSVAQSLKLIKKNLCVVLVSRATRIEDRLPAGLDAMVSDREPLQLLEALGRLIQRD